MSTTGRKTVLNKRKPKSSTKGKPTRGVLILSLDKLWAEIVKKRDKGKCVRCGRPAVHAHHIFSRRHKRTRWDVRNGISLCFRDHWYWVNSPEPQDKQEYLDLIYRSTDVDELKRQSGIVWKPSILDLQDIEKKMEEEQKKA